MKQCLVRFVRVKMDILNAFSRFKRLKLLKRDEV